ncbi:rod shape-determining protein MreC [Ligilactobacillus salitolerans]|uniref:Cell shape-determining protein MreC n=1 Tax=Ligilactobacillus salitolerans TaxID=1808352 RepID=A0A401IR04_9LACO|nr:rod shape-determining protein MreC [Ligilactobacillus salitolerans]GBG93960.1 rod shape-determining protein MreC [Ligilactobacillus salitolerans]
MQKFSFNKRLVITMIVLIVGFLLIALSISVRNNRNAPLFLQKIGNEAGGIVDRIVGGPVKGVGNAAASIEDLYNTYTENSKLKKEVDTIASQKVENQTLKQENKHLKQQMKLNQTLTAYNKINASVLTRTPSSWQNQIVINKGAAAGVKKNDSVLSRRGLAGRVTEVNQTNSKVELLSTTNDSANRFAVRLTTSDGTVVNGLITGYSAEKNQLIMGQTTSKVKVAKKTKVITSGMGGITPQGLLVGKVVRVVDNDEGMPARIYIKPAADFNDLDVVTVARRVE